MLVFPFNRVLLLLVRFTTPVTNNICTKDVLDFSCDFNLGTVTDKFIHGTALPYNIFKGVESLLICFIP